MNISITFPGNKRVDADFNGMKIKTDQPPMAGGDGTAPEPFALFLASIGTCAGIYVLSFCQSRGLSTEGLRLVQRLEPGPGGGIGKISIDIEVPDDFPEKYHAALVRSAEQCAVKKTIENPPEFKVQTVKK